jgi:hypothetical protein
LLSPRATRRRGAVNLEPCSTGQRPGCPGIIANRASVSASGGLSVVGCRRPCCANRAVCRDAVADGGFWCQLSRWRCQTLWPGSSPPGHRVAWQGVRSSHKWWGGGLRVQFLCTPPATLKTRDKVTLSRPCNKRQQNDLFADQRIGLPEQFGSNHKWWVNPHRGARGARGN